MEVRYARPEELNVIAKIIRDQIYPEISLEEMEEWIKGIGWPSNPYVQWFVLEKEGEIIGAMRWEVYDRYGENSF
jgi:ribonuclease HII